MAYRACAVLLLVCCVSQSAAADGTGDGIAAYLAGDFTRAAEILRPIAEHAVPPDHVAQFFMAIMYENGQGVSRDVQRAYALYLLCSRPSSPFSAQASAVMEALARQMTPDMLFNAEMMAAHGFGEGLERTIFTFGPGHWVELDPFGITIEYAGEQKRVPRQMGNAGAIFLPVQYTGLDLPGAAGIRRHFLEFFVWHPGEENGRQIWELLWALFEVVGHDLPVVASEILLTASGTLPPTSKLTSEIREVVTLWVNSNGDVEWSAATTAGTAPARGIVAPPQSLR